jgi:hypothetical protein
MGCECFARTRWPRQKKHIRHERPTSPRRIQHGTRGSANKLPPPVATEAEPAQKRLPVQPPPDRVHPARYRQEDVSYSPSCLRLQAEVAPTFLRRHDAASGRDSEEFRPQRPRYPSFWVWWLEAPQKALCRQWTTEGELFVITTDYRCESGTDPLPYCCAITNSGFGTRNHPKK